MFEEGKRLYLHGEGDWVASLPEEAQAGVEEDYQICVRALRGESSPTGAKPKKRMPRKKK
jgi:hypothetical protein